MNIFTGLLFHHGHIADPKLATSLAGIADESQDRRKGQRVSRRPAQVGKSEKTACYRHGAIFDACSVSLSPFR